MRLAAIALILTACRQAPPPAAITQRPKIVVSSILGGGMVHQVRPKYPDWARRQKIQGVVQLRVLIGKDGHVKELDVVGGPEQLAPYAVEAVKQWQYRPVMIQGESVEVKTQVDVSFTLNQ
jgi:protein TonB